MTRLFVSCHPIHICQFIFRSLLSCSFCPFHFKNKGSPKITIIISTHSLDHSPSVVLEADLQLLEDLAALLQLRSASIWEGHVVNCEALLLVDLQQWRDPVLVKFSSGEENKHLLHPLVLELLWEEAKTVEVYFLKVTALFSWETGPKHDHFRGAIC